MPLSVFCIVLFSAALHASWNALVKFGSDKLLSTAMVTAASAVIAIAVLPFLAQPAAASWPYIGASVLLQLVYFRLLAAAYHSADMSLCYPIMRGCAPLLVAVAGALSVGEALPLQAWFGVAAICVGILGMASGVGNMPRANRRGALLAFLNAFFIAGYTLVDGMGVRRSGSPFGYTLWIFLITGVVFSAFTCLTRGTDLLRLLRQRWRSGLVGGAGSAASYGIALWAMTMAPVAVVAALRETSILFGALIAVLLLKEKMDLRQGAAIGVIVLGAALLRTA